MPTQRLTAAAVEKLKVAPGADRTDYFDSLVPGFCLRVTGKGSKSWAVMYRVGGRLRKMTLGGYPAMELAEAREAARDALRMAARGVDPADAKRKVEAAPESFAAVAARFVEQHAKKRRAWRNTQACLERHVLPYWAARPIDGIARRDVTALRDRLMEGPDPTPHAADHVLKVVRKLFNWAIEKSVVENNPALGLKPYVESDDRDRVLSDVEIAAIWRAAERLGYPFGAHVQLLLLTGQRRDEVARMQWRHVEGEQWTLPKEDVKSGRAHVVPLSPQASALLAALPRQAGPFVLSTTGGERPISGYSKAKARLDELAGDEMEPWRLHDLRRTCATGVTRLGFPRFVAERVLNHAQRGVTQRYDRYEYLLEKREALDAWGAHVAKIADIAKATIKT